MLKSGPIMRVFRNWAQELGAQLGAGFRKQCCPYKLIISQGGKEIGFLNFLWPMYIKIHIAIQYICLLYISWNKFCEIIVTLCCTAQVWLYNLKDPVQNEDVGLFLQKSRKKVLLKVLKYTLFLFFMVFLFLDLSRCFYLLLLLF